MVKFRASVLESEQVSPVIQFLMCLLHSVTNAHILHLSTTSYAEHKALEAFYTEIGDLVDDFAEAYQGKYGLMTDYFNNYTIPPKPIEYMNYLKDQVKTLRNSPSFPQDSELQNITDEIAQLIDSTLYKLRFLK